MGQIESVDDLTPAEITGIKKGMHDFHLGRFYSHRLVFGSFKSTGGKFWFYYRMLVNLKKLWWKIKVPYISITHRNCKTCLEYKRNFTDYET